MKQNSQMAIVTVTYRDGRVVQLENLVRRSAQLEDVEYEEDDEEEMLKSDCLRQIWWRNAPQVL